MILVRRLVGAYLVLVGLAVAVHFVATQFYDPPISGDSVDIWLALDALMAVALVIVLATAIRRKQMLPVSSGGREVTREYLVSKFRFLFRDRVAVHTPMELGWRRHCRRPQR